MSTDDTTYLILFLSWLTIHGTPLEVQAFQTVAKAAFSGDLESAGVIRLLMLALRAGKELDAK